MNGQIRARIVHQLVRPGTEQCGQEDVPSLRSVMSGRSSRLWRFQSPRTEVLTLLPQRVVAHHRRVPGRELSYAWGFDAQTGAIGMSSSKWITARDYVTIIEAEPSPNLS